MLQRAKRISSTLNEYCDHHRHPQFRLNAEEWRQVDYLLCITQPFWKFTTGLSKTKNVTIHNVFRVYNRLFDHLDTSIRQLQRKKVPWKRSMLQALYGGKEKLKAYYRKTEEIHGNLYAIGTILAPKHKLQFFSSREYGNDKASQKRYKDYLQQYIQPYREQLPNLAAPNACIMRRNDDETEELFDDDDQSDTVVRTIRQNTNIDDELVRYLDSGMLLSS
jgi:hypothetical protein